MDEKVAKRAPNGRFLPGHCGGPGNPHARKVHRLRATLLDTVTPEDIQEVVRILLEKAKGGDLVAIKELLDRTIGKPVASVELTGADGEPLLQFGRIQEAIVEALAEFPDARIAVALRLKELVDARPADPDGMVAGPGADDDVARAGAG
jgi:hypothetical protein